ncbi:MAG: hypothetical protein QNL62_02825 [Gammaproteobacteria bacterium]|nr:hypothetical protein [Gammaproteobacteria bacterium]
MNKPILASNLILLILILTQSSAFAHHQFEEKFEKRQQKQSHRIEHGLENSQFTYDELKRLFKIQNKIERLSLEFMEDDHYGHKERKVLRKKLNKLDDMIYRMKHNQKKYNYNQKRVSDRHQREGKRARKHSS